MARLNKKKQSKSSSHQSSKSKSEQKESDVNSEEEQNELSEEKQNGASPPKGRKRSRPENGHENGNDHGAPKNKKTKDSKKGKAHKTSKVEKTKKNTNNIASDDDADDDDASEQGDDGGENYEVENIVDDKVFNGTLHYLIRWKGYSADDDSWEPAYSVSCPELIEKYVKKTKKDTTKKQTASKPTTSKEKAASVKKKQEVKKVSEKEWEVLKIVDHYQEKNGETLYRIRWRGYKAKDDTWEPESHLHCEELIEKYMKAVEDQDNVSVKELREETKKPKRLVNEISPRTAFNNAISRSSKRSTTRHRVYYGDSDD